MLNSKLKIVFIVLCYFLNGVINALLGQADTSVFLYEEYIENILLFHPIAEQASLKIKLANTELLGAKGKIDPNIKIQYDQKEFDEKNYYQKFNSKLVFPSRYGIDVVAGYENNRGEYINPESTTDSYGLWNVGLEVNLLQGLLVNERTTALQQAKNFKELSLIEQQMILNDLLYDATQAYLNWQQNYSISVILKENLELSREYANITKQTFLAGEKTAMDTLEAEMAFQDALIMLQKNEQELIKARRTMQNYLWFDNKPIQLKSNAISQNFDNELLNALNFYNTEELINNPIIQSSINKLSYLEIEQRLKKEKLKPKLTLKYNPLLATSESSINPNYSQDNFKWGVNFSMPLFLRSERADIQRGQLKILETELEIENKKNSLFNKIQASWELQSILEEQRILIANNVDIYSTLLEGEKEKFKFGESSVFLVNKRQEKFISGKIKLVETTIKKQLEILNFLYYTNGLIQ